MSSYAYAVTAKTVKLKQVLNDEKINVRQAKFFCRYYQLTKSDIEKIESRYESKGNAEYIICHDDMNDLYGSVVYKYDSESGHFVDDIDLGTKFHPVGIILGKKRAWYLAHEAILHKC